MRVRVNTGITKTVHIWLKLEGFAKYGDERLANNVLMQVKIN